MVITAHSTGSPDICRHKVFLFLIFRLGAGRVLSIRKTGGRLIRLQQLHVSYDDSQPKIFLSQFFSALATGHDSRGTSLTFCPTGYVNPVPDMPDI